MQSDRLKFNFQRTAQHMIPARAHSKHRCDDKRIEYFFHFRAPSRAIASGLHSNLLRARLDAQSPPRFGFGAARIRHGILISAESDAFASEITHRCLLDALTAPTASDAAKR